MLFFGSWNSISITQTKARFDHRKFIVLMDISQISWYLHAYGKIEKNLGYYGN